ncbi:hypothetical protein C8Q77DRAFT_1058271 [Trametes polyzona]|nr:hypothetical protein C8Q77DRAFT_1058271 [Trametes polyzona]
MSSEPKPGTKAVHPLPLSSTLHDLALLRASDLDLAALLPPSSAPAPAPASAPLSSGAPSESHATETDDPVEQSVQRSLEFAREARAALKLLHSDAVEKQGARVDGVRERLEDVARGLDGTE